MRLRSAVAALLCLPVVGCLSYDEKAAAAVAALQAGDETKAVAWSDELADDSADVRLGEVESGRVHLLAGQMDVAAQRFRAAIEAAVDRKASEPVIRLSDVGRVSLAATVTDDRTLKYALSPYELNLALEYAILAQAFVGKRDDALVDARLACYVQDKLASEYGADLQKNRAERSSGRQGAEVARIVADQDAALNAMIASTRNSWENPVLWWLTGVLLEADGDWEAAGQSYRRAGTTGAGNPFFEADMKRAGSSAVTPAAGRSKLVVIFDDGFVPRRAALKIPLRLYATMSIDVPTYQNAAAYVPQPVSFVGSKGLSSAALGLDVRSLAARDLSEDMPGIVTRNVTRAAVNVGIAAAGRTSGSDAAWVAAELVNLTLVLMRSADTRSWVTLPDAQYVWCDADMSPGNYQLGVNVNGVASTVPVALAPGETKLLWIANCGGALRHQSAVLASQTPKR